MNDATVVIAAAGLVGFGIGVGLVVGAFIARMLRRYAEGEFGRNGKNGDKG